MNTTDKRAKRRHDERGNRERRIVKVGVRRTVKGIARSKRRSRRRRRRRRTRRRLK